MVSGFDGNVSAVESKGMKNDSQLVINNILNTILEEQNAVANSSAKQQSELPPDVTNSNGMQQQLPISSEMAYSFLVLILILSIPLYYFHYLIFRMTRREQKKKEQPLMTQALIIYAVVFPVSISLSAAYGIGILPHVYPPAEVLGSWFCFLVEYIVHFSGMYAGMFSLLSAIMKYRCMVHNHHLKCYGEDKAVKLLVTLHLVIPSVVSFVNLVSNGDKDHLTTVDQCWSHQSEPKNVDDRFLETIGDYFCYNRQYQVKEYFGDAVSTFIEPVLRFICGSQKVVSFLLMSNIIEIFVYYYLCQHLDR